MHINKILFSTRLSVELCSIIENYGNKAQQVPTFTKGYYFRSARNLITVFFLYIMYFSLPKDIPPHPLGGTRVRRHWSAAIYTVITGLHVLYETCIICFVYVHIIISMNKRTHKIQFYLARQADIREIVCVEYGMVEYCGRK